MQAKSLSKDVRAPAAEAFPAYPASWYLFCESRQLKDKPFSQRILGRQLVAYRKASGQVVVMDARCAHLGQTSAAGRSWGTRFNARSITGAMEPTESALRFLMRRRFLRSPGCKRIRW